MRKTHKHLQKERALSFSLAVRLPKTFNTSRKSFAQENNHYLYPFIEDKGCPCLHIFISRGIYCMPLHILSHVKFVNQVLHVKIHIYIIMFGTYACHCDMYQYNILNLLR